MMASIPKICNRCGRVENSGVYLSNVVGFYQGEHAAGTCSCGGTFVVQGAVYNEYAGVLSATARTPGGAATLRRMGVLVQEMLAQGADVDEVRAAISREAPEVAAAIPDEALTAVPGDQPSVAKAKKALLAFAGAMIVAGAAPIPARGGSAVADAIFGEEKQPAATAPGFHPPAGSEGTMTYPDGMKVTWGPGTRPTRRRPGPQP